MLSPKSGNPADLTIRFDLPAFVSYPQVTTFQ